MHECEVGTGGVLEQLREKRLGIMRRQSIYGFDLAFRDVERLSSRFRMSGDEGPLDGRMLRS